MAEKIMNTRSQQKNDTQAKWDLVPNFVPKKGEIIVYNADTNNPTPRVKIGDGTTKLSGLPFAVAPGSITATDDGAGHVTVTFGAGG